MIPYRLVGNEGEQTLTVFLPGDGPKTVPDDHPSFDEVLAEVRATDSDPDRVIELADASLTVSRQLTPISERVSVADGVVFFDGDPIDSTLTRQILRLLDEGDPDWRALVAFLENLAANPVPHSQHRLFGWLQATGDFTITDDGCFIGYKGVGRDSDGTLRSGFSGQGIVNGVEVHGRLDNSIGNVVEMPRSSVQHDPSHACSTGLHVGTYEYAQHYGNVHLAVKVNPRDVVSVPTDANDAKMRVCRYEVLHVASEEYTSPVVSADEYRLGD